MYCPGRTPIPDAAYLLPRFERVCILAATCSSMAFIPLSIAPTGGDIDGWIVGLKKVLG